MTCPRCHGIGRIVPRTGEPPTADEMDLTMVVCQTCGGGMMPPSLTDAEVEAVASAIWHTRMGHDENIYQWPHSADADCYRDEARAALTAARQHDPRSSTEGLLDRIPRSCLALDVGKSIRRGFNEGDLLIRDEDSIVIGPHTGTRIWTHPRFINAG